VVDNDDDCVVELNALLLLDLETVSDGGIDAENETDGKNEICVRLIRIDMDSLGAQTV
jgi:hypothetical protein